jgi:hypothetical protein
MSDALIITPAMRLSELKRAFKAMLPSRRKLSAIQAHHIARAANYQQVIEMAILERALGAKHDRLFIERLKAEVQQHLSLAGAPNQGAK